VRKSIAPGSNERDRSLITFNTERFGSGIVNDPPASVIPESALAYGENIIAYPTEVVPRTGSVLWTSEEIPPLAGRTGYSASKSGYIITCDQNHFTQSDVGRYFVWPGTETEHDEIIRYISGTSVEVANTGDKVWQAGCYMRGHINLWKFHPMLHKWLFMFSNELWIASLDMNIWTSVSVLSRDLPNDAISGGYQFDEYSWVVFNSNGVFKVDTDMLDPIAYRVNIPIPNVAIAEVAETVETDYQYGYLYGAARLSEYSLFRTRMTPVRIETEGGTNAWGSDFQDFNDVWTADPIGPATATYGKLTCATLSVGYRNVEAWKVITNGTFRVNISSVGTFEIFCDFSDVESMIDVAEVIQAALRHYFFGATCEFVENGFVLTSGRIAGGTISYLTAGFYGTDISGILGGLEDSASSISAEVVNTPQVVGPLYVPIVPSSEPQEYQWHLTHFPVYRTLDKNGLYKQNTTEQRLNDPERYVWVYDLRICAAFFARKFNGHVLASIGQFEEADVGSTIEWEDGTRDTIVSYVDTDDVIVDTSSGYLQETIMMAACIGNGRVMRVSQSGTTVTRTHGDSFSASDVRKTIHWSTGYRSIITAYIDANNVTVNDDYDKDEQGITLDPTYRMFNDTVSDDTLRTRETSLLCRTRFLEPLENCNIGVVVPGYMITAQRGAGKIEYSALAVGYDYLVGYCNKGYQVSETIKDDIQFLLMAPNRFIALCSNRVWGGPTSVSEFVTMPKTGVVVPVLGGIDVIDGNIGCVDWGSIQEIEHGVYRMRTNEPGGIGLRDFNGFSFGPNHLEVPKTAQTNWLDSFRNLQNATASLYDGHLGYVLWGNE
jgi:hypothetical protein